MKLIKSSLVSLAILLSSTCLADIAVIVHPANNAAIDKDMVSRIFVGKLKSFPDGEQAVPIDQEGDVAEQFSEKVLSRSQSQLKAYWSKLIFTGKGTPPQVVGNDQEVLQLVAKNPNIIGYVDSGSVNDSVKVIGTF